MLGTLVLVTVGNASIAQNQAQYHTAAFLDINLAYGLACAAGIYVAARTSGGHINPAVTISQLLLGRMNIVQAIVYISAQILGGFLSGPIVYLVYLDAINWLDPDRTVPLTNATYGRPTAGIFATYPTDLYKSTLPVLFFDQCFATIMLVVAINAVLDKRNSVPPMPAVPLLIGLFVVMIGLSFGVNAGYAINPARDFGPRLFSAIIYGIDVFRVGNYYWWIPIVAPTCGAIIGGYTYLLFVGTYLDDLEEPEENKPKQAQQGNAVVPVTVIAAADSSGYPKQVYVTPAPAPTAPPAPVAPEKKESCASSLSSKDGWAAVDSKEGEVHRL